MEMAKSDRALLIFCASSLVSGWAAGRSIMIIGHSSQLFSIGSALRKLIFSSELHAVKSSITIELNTKNLYIITYFVKYRLKVRPSLQYPKGNNIFVQEY